MREHRENGIPPAPDPKRIRERIRRYERALKRELEAGYGGDGYGKRFLLGPLYMLLGVVDKIARYVAIHQALKSEPRGPRRFALVDESFALKRATIL